MVLASIGTQILLVINKSKNKKQPRLGVAESTTLVLRDPFLIFIGLTDLTKGTAPLVVSHVKEYNVMP